MRQGVLPRLGLVFKGLLAPRVQGGGLGDTGINISVRFSR